MMPETGGGDSQEAVMETDSGGRGDGDGGGSGDGDGGDGGGEEAEMQELMQNKEFLQSVLGSLPGVNPEEAMQNLQELTGEKDTKKDEEKVVCREKNFLFYKFTFCFRRTTLKAEDILLINLFIIIIIIKKN